MLKAYVGVKAIIIHDDKVLLLRGTSEGKRFWDLPGGRIDDDESLHEALMRELSEELPGISGVIIKRLVFAYRIPKNPWPDTGLVLNYYEVTVDPTSVTNVSHEHDEFKWMPIDEALQLEKSGVREPLEAYAQTRVA